MQAPPRLFHAAAVPVVPAAPRASVLGRRRAHVAPSPASCLHFFASLIILLAIHAPAYVLLAVLYALETKMPSVEEINASGAFRGEGMQAALFQKGKNASGKDSTLAKLLKSLMEVGGVVIAWRQPPYGWAGSQPRSATNRPRACLLNAPRPPNGVRSPCRCPMNMKRPRACEVFGISGGG